MRCTVWFMRFGFIVVGPCYIFFYQWSNNMQSPLQALIRSSVILAFQMLCHFIFLFLSSISLLSYCADIFYCALNFYDIRFRLENGIAFGGLNNRFKPTTWYMCLNHDQTIFPMHMWSVVIRLCLYVNFFQEK